MRRLSTVILFLLLLPSMAFATVAASTSTITHNCTGTTGPFTFTFNAGSESEVQVIQADADGDETVLAGYTVTCTNDDCSSGGSITLNSACSSGSSVTILRDVDLTQETDFTDGMPALYETFETSLDKQIRIDQQLQEQINRSVTISVNSAAVVVDAELPPPGGGKLLGYNGNGDGFALYDQTRTVQNIDALAVDDMNELKGTSGSYSGQIAFVAGYHAKGDGAGGPLRTWTSDAAPGTYVDNGGSIRVPTAGDGSAAWLGSSIYVWSPEEFGAIGDGSTDDTLVLSSFIDFANSVDAITINFNGLYKTTSPVVITSNNITLNFTRRGESGLYFVGCNGLSIDQSSEYATFRAIDPLLITDSDNLYVGFSYTNSVATTGDQNPKTVDGLVTIGYDRYFATGTDTNGWLNAVYVDNGERLHFNYAWIQGAEQDRINDFPLPTIGFKIVDSTNVKIANSSIFIHDTGVKVEGQSEGIYIVNDELVANNKGIDFQSTTSPSNDWNIINTHIASMDYNINLGVGGADTPIMHNVTGCLLFTRTEAYVSSTFTHIRVKGQAQISGNYFYTAAGIDATSHIGVDIYAPSNGTQVTGNYFFRVPTLVNVQASANTTFIAHNTTEDDATSLAAAPVVDAGTGTRIALNGGDRNFGEVRSDTGVFWSSVASPGFYAGANKLKVITATQGSAAAVNYIDVVNSATGSPPILRPLGTDTDIDLELLAKGAGKIRFGTRASTVDVAITGYITIKDAAGTERKLAIID